MALYKQYKLINTLFNIKRQRRYLYRLFFSTYIFTQKHIRCPRDSEGEIYDMEVKMDSKKKNEKIDNEINYYISNEILIEMYLLGLISLEEYEKITCYNIEEFTPFLGKLML